jgi:hypothetical protein
MTEVLDGRLGIAPAIVARFVRQCAYLSRSTIFGSNQSRTSIRPRFCRSRNRRTRSVLVRRAIR